MSPFIIIFIEIILKSAINLSLLYFYEKDDINDIAVKCFISNVLLFISSFGRALVMCSGNLHTPWALDNSNIRIDG